MTSYKDQGKFDSSCHRHFQSGGEDFHWKQMTSQHLRMLYRMASEDQYSTKVGWMFLASLSSSFCIVWTSKMCWKRSLDRAAWLNERNSHVALNLKLCSEFVLSIPAVSDLSTDVIWHYIFTIMYWSVQKCASAHFQGKWMKEVEKNVQHVWLRMCSWLKMKGDHSRQWRCSWAEGRTSAEDGSPEEPEAKS